MQDLGEGGSQKRFSFRESGAVRGLVVPARSAGGVREEDDRSATPLPCGAHEVGKQGAGGTAAGQGQVAFERHDAERDDYLQLHELDLALEEGPAVREHASCRGDVLMRLATAQDRLAARKALHGSRRVHELVESASRQSELIEDGTNPLPGIALKGLACPVFGESGGLADQEHGLLADAGDDRAGEHGDVAFSRIDLVAGKERGALGAGTQGVVEAEKIRHARSY